VTTRTLVILRHAKTANPEQTLDIERPLTDRGRADAGAAGAWLSGQAYDVDLVLCSPARRARETWHGVALGLTRGPRVNYDDRIYNASASELLQVVRDAEPEASTVLLIGHNPGLSELSSLLDADNADPHGLRTAGLAVHTADADWTAWELGAATLTVGHTARAEDA
jgi:phosphohistidine phosphatase